MGGFVFGENRVFEAAMGIGGFVLSFFEFGRGSWAKGAKTPRAAKGEKKRAGTGIRVQVLKEAVVRRFWGLGKPGPKEVPKGSKWVPKVSGGHAGSACKF